MSSPEQFPNYLHLGDSYTCAEGISPADGWPQAWRARLEGQGRQLGRTHVLAQNGWTCGELLENLNNASLEPEWDWITICVGVNNQYRGLEEASFGSELLELVKQANCLLSNPPGGIILLSIPDWGVSPFAADRDRIAIAAEIDAFNAVIRKVSIQTVYPFVNWTGLTRSFAGQPDAFAPDGLHPSAKQYSAWAAFLEQSKLGY
ncbi:SGNH/GDSL hydrolase family protein [Puniceicoccales bacterium CK1056]|uniref:SGNH/GDSL hydrolase family protein n=1 Tax=Oceanipulchritudo coccoides TaxID=2706888 RepID=A0A6B2M593_9BACT|nr:GDSL-type esterase/lipase family protein [Oceanipulchritudo coccoides]NDV62975.1 SGNH/GDSL hydrolase family protein [Oceanipulchritudo coccoides]